MFRIDLTGNRFGRLTVLRYSHCEYNGSMWICRCDCGKESCVLSASLRNGNTRSCGCLQQERSKEYQKKLKEGKK